MKKVKVFIYDEMVFGGKLMAHFFHNQTYCFPFFTGLGYGLFYSESAPESAYLIENPGWYGAWGDLWHVTMPKFEALNDHYWKKGFVETELCVQGIEKIHTWIAPLKLTRGLKLKSINSYSDAFYSKKTKII